MEDALVVGITIAGRAVLGLVALVLIGLRDSPTDQDSKGWKTEVYILRELTRATGRFCCLPSPLHV